MSSMVGNAKVERVDFGVCGSMCLVDGAGEGSGGSDRDKGEGLFSGGDDLVDLCVEVVN